MMLQFHFLKIQELKFPKKTLTSQLVLASNDNVETLTYIIGKFTKMHQYKNQFTPNCHAEKLNDVTVLF